MRFIAFPRQVEPQAYIGSIVDLRDAEIGQLLANPTLTHGEIIERVKPRVTNGFASGQEVCRDNEEWWWFYRKYLAPDVRRQHAEIAALTHFPTADLSEQVMDTRREYKVRPLEEAQVRFVRMAEELAIRLSTDVKKPLANPQRIAAEFVREAYQEGIGVYAKSEKGIDFLLKRFDVEPGRIPKQATVADVGEEAVFIKQLSIHERRLNLPPGSIRRIVRKEMLPSWLVWRDVDHAVKRLPKAESGNVNDKLIVPFGLYVDGLQLDKRIRNCVSEQARKSKLMAIIRSRLVSGGDYQRLASELDVIASL